MEVFSGSGMEGVGINLQDMFGNLMPAKRQEEKMTIRVRPARY